MLEIIEAAKDNRETEKEELLYALLALDALGTMDNLALLHMSDRSPQVERALERSFERSKAALNKSPKEWVGWNNDPRNPEYQQSRNLSFKIAKKALGVDLRRGDGGGPKK